MRDDLEQRLGIQVALVKRLAHAEERLDVVTRVDEGARKPLTSMLFSGTSRRMGVCVNPTPMSFGSFRRETGLS